MTRLEALKELLAKVEAGCVTSANDTAELLDIGGLRHAYSTHAPNTIKAYNGSLDAAKALHEAVLPDAAVQLTDMRPYRGSGGWLVSINWNSDKHQGANADPACAWLIAILKALIAQEQAA